MLQSVIPAFSPNLCLFVILYILKYILSLMWVDFSYTIPNGRYLYPNWNPIPPVSILIIFQLGTLINMGPRVYNFQKQNMDDINDI